MKRTYIITIVFTVFSFLLCLCYGFFFAAIPKVVSLSENSYRFFFGLKTFIHILPAILGTGLLVGWSVGFGANQSGSKVRFSNAMFGRYKKVLILSLVSVFILTISTEVFEPALNKKLNYYQDRLELMGEYKRVAAKLFAQGDAELAFEYAKLANEIDPTNEDVQKLMIASELAANKTQDVPKVSVSKKIKKIEKFQNRILPEEPYSVFKLLITAQQCLDNEDWFGAHYYAQMAIDASSPKDINVPALKDISAVAWNHISQAQAEKITEEQKIYAKKVEGYSALISGDFLKAYYIFRTLSLKSKALSVDPDVVRYLNIANEKLEEEYFFIDETFNLQGFETVNNVHFSIRNNDGTTSVYFIKGVTPVAESASLVQYLRGLSIFVIDYDGKYKLGKYVPYAKMSSLSTDFFDAESKKLIGITDSIKEIPYIMVNSVDRNKEGIIHKPIRKGGYGRYFEENFVLLPIPYEDFDLVKQASADLDSMNIISLFKFMNKATFFGYSQEVVCQTLLDRILYPLFVLVLLIFIAYTAWNGRLLEDNLFKFKWVLVFPIFACSFHVIYNILFVLFRFVNYGFLSLVGIDFALVVGIIFYILLLFIISLLFLSRKTYSE